MSRRSFLLAVAAVLGCNETRTPFTRAGAQLPLSAESAHVELGVCPFECCVYGRWRADASVALHERRDSTSRVLARISPGTVVSALTGAVHVRPGRLVLHRALDSLFRPGDTLAIHSYVGEGYWRVRRAGTSDSLAAAPILGAADTACVGSATAAHCHGRLLYAPLQVWWAQIQLDDGRTGWTPRAGMFAGADACGVSDPPIEPARLTSPRARSRGGRHS